MNTKEKASGKLNKKQVTKNMAVEWCVEKSTL